MDEQAEGWTVARLGDVCEVNPQKPPADLLEKHVPVTFIPMAAVDEIAGVISRRESRCYGDVRKGYTAFAEGDVILAKITPCFENGKAAIATDLENDIGFGSSEFHVLRPLGGVIAKYIYHYLRQPRFREEAANHMTGTAGQERVSVEYVRDHELPIPPTAEQWRIVETVEALLARVSVARERLERVSRLLNRFRQAVLAAACEGRLTEGWRELNRERLRRPIPDDGYAAAERLPDLPQRPDEWSLATLGSCAERVQYGTALKADAEPGAGIPILRMGNIQDGAIVLDDLKYVPESTQIESLLLTDGDVLFNRTNSPELVGKTAVFHGDSRLTFASYLIRVTTVLEVLLPDYLGFWLNSPWGREWTRAVRTDGVSQSNINGTNLKQMPIPLPTILEQREIIRRVQGLFRLADTVERRVRAAAARTERLPQGILSRAFAGELVPTEAELARAEGRSYETAGEMLERIRAERAGADAANKARKAPATGRKRVRTANRSD